VHTPSFSALPFSAETPRLRPLATHLRIALLGLACFACLPADPASAAGTATTVSATQHYALPAGPLSMTLYRFAAQAGITLTFDAALTDGRRSAGLNGSYGAEAGLSKLLAGSGLEAVRGENGGYRLRRLPAANMGEARLAPVTVSASAARDGTTEGSGSYAPGPSTTAAGLNMSLRETPQSVSVVTRQQIEDQNLNDVTEVLEQTAGIVINSMGPAGSDSNQIYVRGFNVRNSIQVDGTNRSRDYGFGDDLADMVTYDRVEVVRGATGLMSGMGDPGATINMIRKKPTRETQRSFTLKAGSWDNYRSELDVSGSLSESGHVRGRFVAAWQDGQSHIDRQTMERKVAYGIIEWDITAQTMLTLGAEYQDMDNEAAGNHGFPLFNADGSHFKPSRSFNSAADWSYHKRDVSTVFGSLEHAFDDGWLLKFNAEHSRRSYDDAFATAASGTVNPDGSGISTWTGRWAGEPRQSSFDLSASGKINVSGREHDLYLGASHYKAYYRSNGYPLWTIQSIENIFTWDGSLPVPGAIHAKSSESAFDERQTAVFASARWNVSDVVSLITGARVIDWQRDKTSRSFASGKVTRNSREENGVITPYLGLVYDLADNWSAYASYTTIFNPQDRMDVNGSYLDPEEGENYELGIKSEFWDQRLTAAFSVFEVHQDNLAVLDGDQYAPDGTRAYRAESGTRTRGFEVEVAGEVLPDWQLAASYTYSEIKDSDDERMLTEVPRDTFKLFTSYRVPSLGGMKVGGSIRWQGSEYYRDSGPNGETFRQGNYTIVDLMAQYNLTPDLTVALNLNNLFDEHYYTAIGMRGWYGTPRNATVTLKYDF